MDITALLKQSEGKTVEFKQDLSSPDKVIRTIVAFANTAGGTIIIGVKDKTKHICGIENPHKEEEKLANLINDLIAPQVLPEIEVIPWRKFYLLVVQVFPSSSRPHHLKREGVEKGTYIRVGSTNRLADKIMQAELRRVKVEDSFDKQPFPKLNSEALDFRVTSELFSPHKKLTQRDLESLDLLVSHQEKKVPTIGGVILFGNDRLKHFPDAWIQVGRFQGTTKTKIFDTQEITSYPILAIDEVIEFIKKHAMHGINIPEAMPKEDASLPISKVVGKKWVQKLFLSHQKTIWGMPITVVREALINAVVHADYSQEGAPIRISIFDDRIEIENPGLLLFGLTVDEIKRGVSKLRNRVIGQIFYRLGLIERWGSGVSRIIDSCKEAGFSEPTFEEIGTHFRVTLWTTKIKAPVVNEVNQKIIEILKNGSGWSTNEIAQKVGMSARGARTRLIKLIEQGLVVEIGKGPNDPQRKYFYKE